MTIATLKSMSLQLRLPDGPDGEERWHTSTHWGFCDTDAEATAHRDLEKKKQRPGEQWRLLKVYEYTEVVS